MSTRRARWPATIMVPALFAGCSYVPAPRMAELAPSTPVIGYDVAVNDSTEFHPFGPSGPADPSLVFADNIVVVRPGSGPGNQLKSLEVQVGKRVETSGQCTAANGCRFRGGRGDYRIDLGQFAILNGDAIMVSAASEDGQQAQVFLRARKPSSFTGVTSPLLMRASGKASGFKLENLAPSLAGGIQWNFDSNGFRHVGLNGLLTVYTLPDSEYALSLGAVLDLGGYFQVGPTYHMGEKQWNLLVGVRPEFLIGLIPSLKPKD